MAEVREVLFYYELGVFVAAWVLGWLCVWAVSRHTPKFLEAYARMILWNNVVDLCFSLVSAVLMCVSVHMYNTKCKYTQHKRCNVVSIQYTRSIFVDCERKS